MFRVVVETVESYKDLAFAKVTAKEASNLLCHSPVLAVDLKTTGQDPTCDEIKALTIGTPTNDIYIVTPEVINPKFLKSIFDSKSLIVHSGLKDLSFLIYNGCDIKSCWDTCLCERISTRTVDGETLDYSLLACLERHDISNTISFYKKGSFWAEGFTIAGCNYLSLFVRYLFDLKADIIQKNPKTMGLFRLINRTLLISAYMNVSPITINKEVLDDEAEKDLEEIREVESDLYDIFRMINDTPGKLRDVLPLTDAYDFVEPIYDIEDKKAIAEFVARINDTDLYNWDSDPYEDSQHGYQLMKSYAKQIEKYNNVMRRYLAESKLNGLLYQHAVPAYGTSLKMKCIENFPRTTYAKIHKVNPVLVSSMDNFEGFLKYPFLGASDLQYSYKLFEVFDLETFGLGLLAGDQNLIRLSTNKELEVQRFTLDLEEQGVDVGNTFNKVYRLLRHLVSSCFSMQNSDLINNGFLAKDAEKIIGVVRKRYAVAVEAISSMIKQLSENGSVLLFDVYPMSWPNHDKVSEIKKMFVGNFWETYQAHYQAKDSVYDKVQFFYAETRKADKAIRKAIIDYASSYVLNNVMDKVFTYIKDHKMEEIVTIKAKDDSSFILEYPESVCDFADELEINSEKLVGEYFGKSKLPMIITNI